MPGRHRDAGVLRHRMAGRTPVVVAAVAVMATAAVVVVQTFADAQGCSRDSGVEVTVAADPAIAPALREAASGWLDTTEPEIDGRCVGIQVTDATTAQVASALATEAGGTIDVATPSPEPAALPAAPDVWVPDSSYWLGRMEAISRSVFAPDQQPLATSPIVLAAAPDAADLLGTDPVPLEALGQLVEAELPLTVAEPRRDTAGLVGTVWLQAALAPGEEDLPAAVALFRGLGEVPPDASTALAGLGDTAAAAPVSEQAVIAHNQSQPPVPVTAVPVDDAPALDFPYAVVASRPRNVQTAATMFRNALAETQDVFTRHGFRTVDGTAGRGFPRGNGIVTAIVPALPVGPPEQVSQVLRIWISSRSDARVLSVVNANASMLEPMAGQAPPSRLQVFQATAQEGLELFTPDSQLGIWEYADERVEVLPIETLTDEHEGEVLAATSTLQVRPSDELALFETLLAAYQEMKDGYDPTRSNTLLMWTDGANNQPDGPSLEDTLRELERLVDVTRPIRVILLGLGPDADMEQLEAIAQATGGGAYHLLEPEEIRLIFLQALLT